MFVAKETYYCTMDENGRIPVPAKFRKSLGDLADAGFVVKRSLFYPCLELYISSEWDKELERLNANLNSFNPDDNDFFLAFTAGTASVEMDKSNRILIPKDLITLIALERNVRMVPMMNRYQVWGEKDYEEHLKEVSKEFASNKYANVISQLKPNNQNKQ
ncbi:MAG: hypothetical protein PHR20_00970 [Bacteroidales bacterium]|nr:hypothetical protein [Bacteroidales bacterium]